MIPRNLLVHVSKTYNYIINLILKFSKYIISATATCDDLQLHHTTELYFLTFFYIFMLKLWSVFVYFAVVNN